MTEITEVKDVNTLLSFLFTEMLKIGEINNKLYTNNVKLKVLKLILPRNIRNDYVSTDSLDNISSLAKKAGILIEFTCDADEVLYQFNSTDMIVPISSKDH